MTASHIQLLRAGPVQPIGLPPTTAMGVTNARILHRRLVNNNNEAASNNRSLNLLGAKRCLFGSPEPGEIQSLYIEEMRRNRDHFLQRYNYDILADRFVVETESNEKLDTTATQKENSQKSQNSEDAESRLQADQSKSDSTLNTISCGSICDKECNLDNIKLLTITNNKTSINSAKVIPPAIADSSGLSQIFKDKKCCERLKPYSRQNLITEYYTARKTVTSVAHTLDVSQLPKPQKAKLYNPQQDRLKWCEDL